jgi:hypothetical protein
VRPRSITGGSGVRRASFGPGRCPALHPVVGGLLRVGACQTPEILGDLDQALLVIEDFAAQARAAGVELMLFPECVLQGYLVPYDDSRGAAAPFPPSDRPRQPFRGNCRCPAVLSIDS